MMILERIRNSLLRTYILLLAICLLAVLLSACQSREWEDSGVQEEEEVEVVINLKASFLPSTYAAIQLDESKIEEIDVLVFKVISGEEFYAYRSKAVIEKGHNEYTVTLQKDLLNQSRIVVLTNARKYIDKALLPVDVLKEYVLRNIESTVDGRWDSGTLPMWGESENAFFIDEGVSVPSITLMRSLSRVDITSALPLNHFNLKEVYIYNWKTRGRVAPITEVGWYDPLLNEALKSSLPVGQDNINGIIPLKYEIENDINQIKETIYIHEAAAPEGTNELDATCLIVGGQYDNKPDITWYRIDFQKKENDQYTFLDILRNHHYTFNVVGVDERGYESPDSAFYFKKANITVEITTWNIGDLPDIPIGGNYGFSFSQSRFDFTPAVSEAILNIVTDYPGEWTLENEHPELFTIEKRKNTVYIKVTSTAMNQSFTSSFSFKAEKFTKLIHVNYTV